MTSSELREIRERLGMTQEQLAEALGFRSGGVFVSHMETGVRTITPRTARQVRQLEELEEARRTS